MGRSAQKCPSSILKAWRGDYRRNGGKAYTDAVTQILSKNAQAKKLTIVKPSGPEFDKLVANSKKTVHSWWINKTKNGQEVYNKAVKFLADIRKRIIRNTS